MPEVRISGLAHDGAGVGRLPSGEIVFVPDAIEGDVVTISQEDLSSKRPRRASKHTLHTPSEHRQNDICHNQQCGGCPLRKASPQWQLRAKAERVKNNLRRIGKIQDQDLEAIHETIYPTPSHLRYRHRARLHAVHRDGTWHLGYRQARSDWVAAFSANRPLPQCPILWPELEATIHRIRTAIANEPVSMGYRSISIVYSRIDQAATAAIEAVGALGLHRKGMAWLSQTDLRGWSVKIGDELFDLGNQRLRYDHSAHQEFDIMYTARTFTQANPDVNDLLVGAVVSTLQGRSTRVLECHAGIGNFSLALHQAGVDVIATEISSISALMLRSNIRKSGFNIEAYRLADTEVEDLYDQADTLLMDPPRAGAKALCESLANNTSIRTIAYVSCDAASFARDIEILYRQGFKLERLEYFDMFAHSAHLETFGLLSRA